MATRDILYLTIDTLLDVEVKKNFPLLSVGWYLFRVMGGNRHLPRGSIENALYITNIGNVFVARWVIPLVNIPLLDCIIIHRIRWIQWNLLRKNSIKYLFSVLPYVHSTHIQLFITFTFSLGNISRYSCKIHLSALLASLISLMS